VLDAKFPLQPASTADPLDSWGEPPERLRSRNALADLISYSI